MLSSVTLYIYVDNILYVIVFFTSFSIFNMLCKLHFIVHINIFQIWFQATQESVHKKLIVFLLVWYVDMSNTFKFIRCNRYIQKCCKHWCITFEYSSKSIIYKSLVAVIDKSLDLEKFSKRNYSYFSLSSWGIVFSFLFLFSIFKILRQKFSFSSRFVRFLKQFSFSSRFSRL